MCVCVYVTLTDQASTSPSNTHVVTNPVRGHQEVRRSTDHIMVTNSLLKPTAIQIATKCLRGSTTEKNGFFPAPRRCLWHQATTCTVWSAASVFKNLSFKLQRRRLPHVLPIYQKRKVIKSDTNVFPADKQCDTLQGKEPTYSILSATQSIRAVVACPRPALSDPKRTNHAPIVFINKTKFL